MAPRPDAPATALERSSAGVASRKRRRVAPCSGQTALDASWNSCESAEECSSGSDGEWAPDEDGGASSLGGGGSDSDDDHASASGGDDEYKESELKLQELPLPWSAATMGHTPELFCSICEREFSFKHSLVRHLKRRHKSDERPFECAVCRLAFHSKQELKAHATAHKVVKGVWHKCKGCDQSFATRHERRQHFRKTHSFSCPFRTCGDRFAEQFAWTKHIRRYHKAVAGVAFDCAVCQARFQTRHELEWHQQQQAHEAFACTYPSCGKAYSKREHLTRHVAAAHYSEGKEKLFQCDLCQARFTYKHGLVRHTSRSHANQDRPYRCSVCQLAFKKKALLQAHSYVHTGVLPFECDVCGERFLKRFLLVRHQRSHSGNTPASTQVFVCDVAECGTILFSAEEQREHMKQEHQVAIAALVLETQGDEHFAIESKDPTVAPDATKASSQATESTQTRGDDTSPSRSCRICQVCGHTFGRQSSLRSHLRTHFESVDERKLFACPVAGCGKTYTRASNVMAHYNAVHDARKSQRFVCPHEECNGRFGRKSILTKHIAKIHARPVTAEPDKPRPTRKRKAKGVLERALGVSDQREDSDTIH